MRALRIHFQEFVKERPVVDDCLTHLFRARFTPLPSQRECSSGAVILYDHRMIDRQVVCTPIGQSSVPLQMHSRSTPRDESRKPHPGNAATSRWKSGHSLVAAQRVT